jgi:hypothetical protein
MRPHGQTAAQGSGVSLGLRHHDVEMQSWGHIAVVLDSLKHGQSPAGLYAICKAEKIQIYGQGIEGRWGTAGFPGQAVPVWLFLVRCPK